MKIEIDVNEWNNEPTKKRLAVNESSFEHSHRYKYYSMYIIDGEGFVTWLTQEGDYPTSAWKKEIVRAFKANGLADGAKIKVKFGSRDNGCDHKFTLIV